MRTVHELKTLPEYFQPVIEGKKTFEVRRNDRDFKVGDYLNLKEYHPKTLEYTGCNLHVEVTYILNGYPFTSERYVIMGIKPVM